MYTEEDLDAAVAAGVMTKEAAEAFKKYVAEQQHTFVEDEERFRLVSGFNDIFVVIASVLLLVSLTWLGARISPWAGPLASAFIAWGLAEFFTRKRRMALPSIVLLVAFVGNVFYAVAYFLSDYTKFSGFTLAAGFVACAAAWLHWRRFHVPITIAAGFAAGTLALIFSLFSCLPQSKEWAALIFFVMGLVIFFAALFWDASDTKRETRRSDVAFWLHLLAAPFLVHPVFLTLGIDGAVSVFQAGLVVLLYLGISLVSILINRRALMVSSLGYVLYVFAKFLKETGTVELGFSTTGFVVGAALLLLSAFWHPCRRFVLGLLPGNLTQHFPSS